MIKKPTFLTLDANNEAIVTPADASNKHQYFFGETIGVLVFRPWYPAISTPGHFANMTTYDFPVRLGFVDDPFDPAGYVESSEENRGWNIENWVHAARQLEADGVRAIVCGCGLAGSIHSDLTEAVDIPIYSSSLQFINQFSDHIGRDKRVGIICIGESFLMARKGAIFQECGVEETASFAVTGMYESAHNKNFMKYMMTDGDVDAAADDIVNTARNMIEKHPDIGGFLLECTDIPPFSRALKKALGLPVFDPVDMVRWVYDHVN